jgi:hypothetical protein
MQQKKKQFYDDQGNFILRPYRLKDLAVIYDVSTRTLRRWINDKAPQYGNKTKKYFSIEQVKGITSALGMPQKICTVVTMYSQTKAA